ncbi:MAG: hypothetical protein HY550_11685 [Elusimicrobia bacterium]|nr:hypothetical protein [Elusimicrobiota bacterium]
MKIFSFIACMVFLAGPAAAAESPYRTLAERLSALAGKKIETVAVLPFGCAESTGTSMDGRMLGERLTTELVNLGKFTVIDSGRISKVLGELGFKPEDGAGPELAEKLDDEFEVDALVTGMTANLGDGWSELNARLVNTDGGAVMAAVRITVARDWAGPVEPRNVRAALRALAKQRVKVTATPEWTEFARLKAGSLATRLSIVSLGGREKLADFETEVWKAYPAETVNRVYFYCSAANCDAIGAGGEGYFKVYFPDGFVLQLDEAGDILDCYYPERSYARLKMRLLARRRGYQNMVKAEEWVKFREVMDYKYVPVPEKRDPDSLRTELDKWKLSYDEKVTGIFTAATDQRSDFYKATFSDGFTLVFDGPSGEIERCEYQEPERTE